MLDCEGWIEFSDWQLGISPRLYFKDDRVYPFEMSSDSLLHGAPIVSGLYYDKSHVLGHKKLKRVQIAPHPQEPDSWMVEVMYEDDGLVRKLAAWVKR